MNYKLNIFLILIILIIAFSLKYLFKNEITIEIIYIFFTLIIFIFGILFLFNHESIIKERKLVQIGSLALAFMGTSIWFIGELLVYFGKTEHPLLDTIGAAGASIGSLLALITFIRSIK